MIIIMKIMIRLKIIIIDMIDNHHYHTLPSLSYWNSWLLIGLRYSDHH